MATTDDEATTSQPTPSSPRSPNGLSKAAKRYGPFVVVAVVIVAAIAIFGGGDGDDEDGGSEQASGQADSSVDRDELIRNGPMTPERAELEGETDVDFGPNCDPETERIKLPMVYAPPCVVPFDGDNGGATSSGVTEDEILLVRYETDPSMDPLLAAQIAATGAEINPETALQTAQDYLAVYQQAFETYGRTVRVEPFVGSGPSDDAQAALADARAIADLEPFAVIGGPQRQTGTFAEAIAAEGILCVGTCAVAVPENIIEAGYPYIWPLGPTTNEAAAMAAEMIGKLAGPGKAEMAGDEETRAQDRVYAMVHYDTVEGFQRPVFEGMVEELEGYDITLELDIEFELDINRMQENVRAWVAQLKDAGVTTVIYTGDPVTPGALTKEATAQDFHPEWILGQSYLADQSIFGRSFDQAQWINGFGIHLGGAARSTEETGDQYRIYEWAYGTRPPNDNYNILEPSIRQLFIGIHLAGPELTPESYRDGLFRYPPTGGSATSGHVSWGDHGIWPDIDYGGQDDAGIIWWDPDAEGEDETGEMGTGLYRFANGGQRYRLGEFPESLEEAGLFDEASSVTIYEEIPEDQQAPDYPPPGG